MTKSRGWCRWSLLAAVGLVVGCRDGSDAPELVRYGLAGPPCEMVFGPNAPYLYSRVEEVALVRSDASEVRIFGGIGSGGDVGDESPTMTVDEVDVFVGSDDDVVSARWSDRTFHHVEVESRGLDEAGLQGLLAAVVRAPDIRAMADAVRAGLPESAVVYAGPAASWDLAVDYAGRVLYEQTEPVDSMGLELSLWFAEHDAGPTPELFEFATFGASARASAGSLAIGTQEQPEPQSAAEFASTVADLALGEPAVGSFEGLSVGPDFECGGLRRDGFSVPASGAVDEVEVVPRGAGWTLHVTFVDGGAFFTDLDDTGVTLDFGAVHLVDVIAPDRSLPVEDFTADATLTRDEADLFARLLEGVR